MTKSQLIDLIAKDAGISKAQSSKALNSMLANVTRSLRKGSSVSFIGFGSFDVKRRKAFIGRNPRTGEAINIPATKSPRFRPGKNLRDAIR